MKTVLWVSLAVICLALLAGCAPAQAEQLPPIKSWQKSLISTEGINLAAAEPDADGVSMTGVGLAEDGAMLIINFKGPAKLIQTWNQGSMYVVDEATGIDYSQIPVAPVIGPLFGKPVKDGQPGYVMLNNPDPGIKSGSVVTVVLGKYKRVHVTVK
jgi:hypothetical protein